MNTLLPEAEALARACKLARDYYSRNMSPLQLMKDSGYADHRAAITEDKIKAFISSDKDVIADWISYSMNKRCSGWYFTLDQASDKFIIGHTEQKERSSYSEPIQPCAKYIKLELESIYENAG